MQTIDLIALLLGILARMLLLIGILPSEVGTGVLRMIVCVTDKDQCKERSTGAFKDCLDSWRVLDRAKFFRNYGHRKREEKLVNVFAKINCSYLACCTHRRL